MKRLILFCFLLSLGSSGLSAQVSDPVSWNGGWVSEQEVAIMELDSSYNFELILEFWINNPRLVPLEIEFETEWGEGDEDFSIDDPGKVSVDANSNETFDLIITGSGIDSEGNLIYAGDDYFDTFDLNMFELIGGQRGFGSSSITQKVQLSSIFNFDIEFIDNNVIVGAGSDETVSVEIHNTGNVNNAISDIDFTFRSCPQIDYELNSDNTFFGGGIVEPKSWASGVIKIIASTNHPEKNCKLIVTVTSDADGSKNSEELEFKVKAPSPQEEDKQSPDENNSVGDLRDTEFCDTYDCEDNTLSYVQIQYILGVIFLALLVRRE